VVADEREEPGPKGLAVDPVGGERGEYLEEDVLAGVLGVFVLLEGFEQVAIDVGEVIVVEAPLGAGLPGLCASDDIDARWDGSLDVR
jgi:hypothetical protein